MIKANNRNIVTTKVFRKSTILYGLLVIIFSGCLGPEKINKWVVQQYDTIPLPSKEKIDGIVISTSIPPMGDELASTTMKTEHMLPLIIYWQWENKNTCSLNPLIPINNFTTTVLNYSNKGLKQKLNGRHIELVVEKIPSTFAVDDKNHLIWLIYSFSWDNLAVLPQDKEMIVSYKLYGADNTEIKRGSISVNNYDKGVPVGMFQSLKNKTFKYLDQYNESITFMSKIFVDKLMVEL